MASVTLGFSQPLFKVLAISFCYLAMRQSCALERQKIIYLALFFTWLKVLIVEPGALLVNIALSNLKKPDSQIAI